MRRFKQGPFAATTASALFVRERSSSTQAERVVLPAQSAKFASGTFGQ
jgi:hypothetical protein